MRALGAEIIEHGRDFDEAREHCEAIWPQREGLRYVHSANEPDLIAGVGTYALEIFDELPEPRRDPGARRPGHAASAAPAWSRPQRSPQTQRHRRAVRAGPGRDAVLAAEAGRRNRHASHLRRGHGDAHARRADARYHAKARARHGAGLRRRDAGRDPAALAATHNLAEGAGAASTAAAFQIKDQLAGKTVVGVLSGGNLDLRELKRIL